MKRFSFLSRDDSSRLKQRTTRKTQSAPCLTVDQVLALIKVSRVYFPVTSRHESGLANVTAGVDFLVQVAPLDEVQREVEGLLSRADGPDLQPSVGLLASALVSRSLANPAFYTSNILVQLVRTQFLCHR